MVIIKGVKLYQNGEMREYSDLDIMQMMGRAVSLPPLILHSNCNSRQLRADRNLVCILDCLSVFADVRPR